VPAVSDSGPLIHLAQTSQIRLLKSLFDSVLLVPAVKREVVDEGIRWSHPDAKLVAEALEEGYIIVRRINSRISNRASKLARREKISEADSERGLSSGFQVLKRLNLALLQNRACILDVTPKS